MELKLSKKTVKHIAIGAIVCILIYWLINETERVQGVLDWILGILTPFIVGAVLAFILNVPTRALENVLKGVKNEKLRRTLAIGIASVCLLLVLTGVFLLLIPALIDTAQSLIPRLQSFFLDMELQIDLFLTEHPEIMEWLTENTDLENFDWGALVQNAIGLVGTGMSSFLQQMVSTIGNVLSGAVNAVIAVVFSVYALYQKELLARQGRRILYAFLPERVSDSIVRVLRLTNSTFSNFLSGQCIEVCILGSMFAITMAILQMPYIPLISVLVAVTAFIPVVGAWIGCIVGAFLIFVTNPLQAVIFVIMFVVLQQIENNLIYPRVVGASIGLSGMWVLVAVAFGGQVMGVIGMFLMIPIASVIYTLLSEHTANRLKARELDSDKLVPQPPILQSKFKQRRERSQKKRNDRKAVKNAVQPKSADGRDAE